jgi:hypothetical protein
VVETVCKHCHVIVRVQRNFDGGVLVLHPAPLCEAARRIVEQAGGSIETITIPQRDKPS